MHRENSLLCPSNPSITEVLKTVLAGAVLFAGSLLFYTVLVMTFKL